MVGVRGKTSLVVERRSSPLLGVGAWLCAASLSIFAACSHGSNTDIELAPSDVALAGPGVSCSSETARPDNKGNCATGSLTRCSNPPVFVNGCGPAPVDGGIAGIIPKLIHAAGVVGGVGLQWLSLNVYAFNNCCSNHDAAYGTCSNDWKGDRSASDNTLGTCMASVCSKLKPYNPAKYSCLAARKLIYNAVYYGGRDAYVVAQRAACACVASDDASDSNATGGSGGSDSNDTGGFSGDDSNDTGGSSWSDSNDNAGTAGIGAGGACGNSTYTDCDDGPFACVGDDAGDAVDLSQPISDLQVADPNDCQSAPMYWQADDTTCSQPNAVSGSYCPEAFEVPDGL